MRPDAPADQPPVPIAKPRAEARVVVVPRYELEEPAPWFVRFPRILGGALTVAGLAACVTVYEFLFSDGTLRYRPSRFVFYAAGPMLLFIGAWLLACGVPRAPRPRWWKVGMVTFAESSVWRERSGRWSRSTTTPKVFVDPRHPYQGTTTELPAPE